MVFKRSTIRSIPARKVTVTAQYGNGVTEFSFAYYFMIHSLHSKSLENIMNLKNVNHDTISMSKTDISIVYGMYKNLLQKNNVNNEAHIENYQVLL